MSSLTTSPLGHDLAVAGLLLQVSNGASPDVPNTVFNVTDLTLPLMSDTIDVTNVGDLWKIKQPTLHDMGKISFKIFYIPKDVTHRNSPTAGAVAAGLLWLFLHNADAANAGVRDWFVIFPDAAGGIPTEWSFPAAVTSFSLTAKTGNAFEATIELTNSDAPSLQ